MTMKIAFELILTAIATYLVFANITRRDFCMYIALVIALVMVILWL